MERVDITKNGYERLSLVVAAGGFILIHEVYPHGDVSVIALSPEQARSVMEGIEKHLPAVEQWAGVTPKK